MKKRPLFTRLRAARILLSEWQRALLDSERVRGAGPDHGTVDAATAHELTRFFAAREAIAEAIKALGAKP